MIEWLVENVKKDSPALLASKDPAEHQRGVNWFHRNMLPPGVESTIYTVNRTLVTVQATYLLPDHLRRKFLGPCEPTARGI